MVLPHGIGLKKQPEYSAGVCHKVGSQNNTDAPDSELQWKLPSRERFKAALYLRSSRTAKARRSCLH